MRAFIYIILAMGITNTQSCKSNYTPTEQAVMKCVNDIVNRDIMEAYGKPTFDFYEHMLEVEQLLLEEKVIDTSTKVSYLNLLQNLKEKTNATIYNKILKLTRSRGFDFYVFITTNAIFVNCPYEVSKNSEEGGELFYDLAKAFSHLYSDGYNEEKAVKKIFDIINLDNFNDIIYRAPIITLVIINMQNNYDLDVLKRKEEVRQIQLKLEEEKQQKKKLQQQEKN